MANIKGISKTVIHKPCLSFLLNRSSWLLLISAFICGHNSVGYIEESCNSTKHYSICIYHCLVVDFLFYNLLNCERFVRAF